MNTEELDRLLLAMINFADGISDLLFVAGRPLQVEVEGDLKPFVSEQSEPMLTSERIEGLAMAIINNNQRLLQDLKEHGSCDCGYTLKNTCRFRVNIYFQNGNYAMVLRYLKPLIPSFESLHFAPVFHDIIKEKSGLIFVTGGTGKGKTTTIAAMRQSPKIIFIGEIRDRETMEIVLNAGETGHLVLSTLQSATASGAINRILGMFSGDEEHAVRERLAGSMRFILSQRLIPANTGGRLLVTELMGNSMRTREAILLGENENRQLEDIIEAGGASGWHTFEQSLIKACEQDLITKETALLYCSNKMRMLQRIDNLYLNSAKNSAVNAPELMDLRMREEETAARIRGKPQS